jgi:hypothetical protein
MLSDNGQLGLVLAALEGLAGRTREAEGTEGTE